jgi:hypothetical protein
MIILGVPPKSLRNAVVVKVAGREKVRQPSKTKISQ